MSMIWSMSAFALAMSISPGPVNVMTLSSALRHGALSTAPFVGGAAVGFTALLLAIGLSVGLLPDGSPYWQKVIGGIGALIIIYFGLRIAFAAPHLEGDDGGQPGFLQGLLLQWVNPKAWAACLGAVSLFELTHAVARLTTFSALYFVMCLIGVGAWAVLGRSLRRVLANPRNMRLFNLLVGCTLVALALELAWEMVLVP